MEINSTGETNEFLFSSKTDGQTTQDLASEFLMYRIGKQIHILFYDLIISRLFPNLWIFGQLDEFVGFIRKQCLQTYPFISNHQLI